MGHRIKFLLLSVAFSFLFYPGYSQKWEKYFVKSEASYEFGDYSKANATLLKAEKKARKKLGEQSAVFANIQVRKAKYNEGQGLLTEIEDILKNAVQISEAVNDDNPIEKGFIYKESAKVLIDYGNFKLAGDYIAKARETFKNSNNLIEDIEAELEVLEAQVLGGKGYYRKAIELVDNQMPFFQKRVEESKKKKKDTPRREFAKILIVKANAMRMMGNYRSSDSAFVFNENWIDKNLGKTDILYAKNKYLNTQLLEESGLNIDAQLDLYQDAYSKATRKYANSQKDLMKIRESLMKASFLSNKISKLKGLQAEYKKTLNSYPKNSVFQLSDDLIKLSFRYLDQNNLSSVEETVQKLLAEDIIPKHHSYRVQLLQFAVEIGLLRGTHQNTENFINQILSTRAELQGEETPEYHLSKLKLANYLIDFTDKLDDVSSIYENSFFKIVEPEIGDGHVQYLDILNHLAKYYEESDNYEKAGETLDMALLAARKKYDNKDILYAKELEQIAGLQIRIGNYDGASENLKEAVAIVDELKTDESKTLNAKTKITQAKLLAIQGEYDLAEKNIWRADKILRKTKASIETSNLSNFDDLAGLYVSIGRLRAADELIEKSLAMNSDQFGEKSRYLNDALVLQSELELIKGNYTDAEKSARRANDITMSIFGDGSTKTAPSSIALADVYSTIGDYDKAEGILTKVIDTQKKRFGESHIDVGKTIAKLALVKFYKDASLEEVSELFQQSERIIGQKLGSNNPTYAEILKDLAILNIASDKYNIAFTYLDEAGRIWNSKIGKRNNINAATINVLKGDIYYRQKDYEKAEDYYQNAKKQYEKFFGKRHPEYVKVQSKLSKTYFMKGEWKRSQDQMESVLESYARFINDYFPALSEREKAKFWNTIKPDYEFYNTLIVSKNRNEKYIGELFNNALLTKALLLNSSIKIRERIYQSGDQELIKLYVDWVDKKELLTAALSMTLSQLEENEIDTDRLSAEVEAIEKQLSEKSEIFSQEVDKRAVTWQNVRESLNENEVAIEMVRFRKFDQTFSSDSIKYALLYVTGEKKAKPNIILLENGKDLENRFLKYYRNVIKFQGKDRRSYDQFWWPIARTLGSLATLYISPDGVYNQINLEAIPTPDGKYVLDNSNIILLSNTKDLYFKKLKKEAAAKEDKMASMFGNPTFYMETKPGIPVPGSGLSRSNAQTIQQLPGTKREIDQLKDYLKKRGWSIDEYTESEATEPAIKGILNPQVFHVATHGFFESKAIEANALNVELKENYIYENPLLKTGLLLSGAGDILNQTQFNYNVDNGILTAYEAMNLNLDDTDLVVLSACETGLGEIEAGEGVYGLQRAFLVAGAKTIVMSLFKVSDDATQQLMVKFYQKWLETGNKRQAFIDAKKEIRNEYGHPIFWGPFVMIGLD